MPVWHFPILQYKEYFCVDMKTWMQTADMNHMITDEEIRHLAEDAWADIEPVWEKLKHARGARRKLIWVDVKELMICKLEGVHMLRRHQTEQLRYELLQQEETHPLFAQKEALLSSLEDASDKIYAQKLRILDLKKEILCLQEDGQEDSCEDSPPRPWKKDQSTQTPV